MSEAPVQHAAQEPQPACEVSWFSALCDDDYEFLGVSDPLLKSSWEHCRDIVLAADTLGFDNILLPSGYSLGIDTTAFAAAIAPLVRQIHLLLAVRIGETWPPQLARQIATIDRILGGRLTVNIISSDMPGETMPSAPRYRRTIEAMQILKTLLSGQALDYEGEFWKLKLDPPRIGTVSGKAPLLYFGGMSPDAREAAAIGCDVFLMWPDKEDAVRALIADMRARAAKHGRTLRFGYRAHVIVRETEAEARTAADRLLSKLDAAEGAAIRARSLDTKSTGVGRTGRTARRRRGRWLCGGQSVDRRGTRTLRMRGGHCGAMRTRCWQSWRAIAGMGIEGFYSLRVSTRGGGRPVCTACAAQAAPRTAEPELKPGVRGETGSA